MCAVVSYPPLPFWHAIPGGLNPGKMVEIRGTVPHGCESFQINFTAGMDSGGYTADRIFHLSIRPTQRLVVRNTLSAGNWEAEERNGAFPFVAGKQFTILILVEGASYRVAVNGQHQWEFFHRHPVDRARMLFIDGSVRIEEVRIFEKQPPVPSFPVSPQSQSVTINSPPVPFCHYIPGGMRPGLMIRVSGRPIGYPNKMTFNLQAGSMPYPPPDIAFHFDVRFSTRSVVRNTRVNDSWQSEELSISTFPFQPGVHFDMIIRVDNEAITVAVNGMPFVHFRHRLFPLQRFDTFFVENDIILASVTVDQF